MAYVDPPPLADHEHDIEWRTSEIGSLRHSVVVRFYFRCGCGMDELRPFAEAMRAQRGWKVRTSKGYGGGYSTLTGQRDYYVWVSRRSLR